MVKIKQYYYLILFAILFYGCSSTARFANTASGIPERKSTERKEMPTSIINFNPEEVKEPLEIETGIASYYADEFNGRPTASGVIYDMHKISAAHPFHPLGTIARVTNLANNRSVILEINDRMPYREDRIIDLSFGAARELDILIIGIQKVRVEVLKWGDGKKIDRMKNPF